ncbi:hypothetical protein GCM10027294_02690 [Marinactinospora endophytica]
MPSRHIEPVDEADREWPEPAPAPKAPEPTDSIPHLPPEGPRLPMVPDSRARIGCPPDPRETAPSSASDGSVTTDARRVIRRRATERNSLTPSTLRAQHTAARHYATEADHPIPEHSR